MVLLLVWLVGVGDLESETGRRGLSRARNEEEWGRVSFAPPEPEMIPVEEVAVCPKVLLVAYVLWDNSEPITPPMRSVQDVKGNK